MTPIDDTLNQPVQISGRGTLADYVAIARLDHSTKHIFIVPGIALAYILRGVQAHSFALHLVLGFLTAICIASANYVINEYLDRDFDKFHPTKSARSAVQRTLDKRLICVEWLLFTTLGLSSALLVSKSMFLIACVFGMQGLFYNVPPLRTKDKAFLDVISESINNPLRLMIGWAMVDPTTLPPSSVILAYWFGGAFLMAAKRLSEYREITASHGTQLLVRYRASFARYSEQSLNASCLVYALLSIFFLAVFLIKYRVEYIIIVPVIIALFGQYISLSMAAGSTAQRPERLFRERGLVALVILLMAIFIVATTVDMPLLSVVTEQRFISL